SNPVEIASLAMRALGLIRGPGGGQIAVAACGGGGLVEIIVAEAVEARAARQDLARSIAVDAGIVQHPARYLREARVEMRKVARHANIVGPAQELDDRADLALAALDRREAVALPILVGRQLEIRRIGLVV